MAFKISGFGASEEVVDTTLPAPIQQIITPQKSLVQVYFPNRNQTLTYFNDQFDLKLGDVVFVDGKLIRQETKKYYIMLNKPTGYVTTAKDQFERKTVLDLVQDLDVRLYPVGRLDYDSEGLLFLSNDGDFTYHLTHPKSEVTKKYKVLVVGNVLIESVRLLRAGVEIDGKKTAPCRVEITGQKENSTELTFVISEGRNRQIRKMCEAVGHDVIKLKRVAIGNVMLGNLPKGKWRHLTEGELNLLMDGEKYADNQRGRK